MGKVQSQVTNLYGVGISKKAVSTIIPNDFNDQLTISLGLQIQTQYQGVLP